MGCSIKYVVHGGTNKKISNEYTLKIDFLIET